MEQLYQMSNRRRMKNARIISNLCPNCFSTLTNNEDGTISCTGDRLTFWKTEAENYKKLSPEEQKLYLDSLEDSSKFLQLVATVDNLNCGYSSQLSAITSNNSTRIPDAMAVGRLERKLGRQLTELELEEGFKFEGGYCLPFINFPEDA
jgi:hypothetical protein